MELVERKSGGPLPAAAAEDDGGAARDLHRRTVPATARSRSIRTAAGARLSARLVQRVETHQLLSLLAQVTALSESLADRAGDTGTGCAGPGRAPRRRTARPRASAPRESRVGHRVVARAGR